MNGFLNIKITLIDKKLDNMSKRNNITLTFNNPNTEEKLKGILEWLQLDITKDLVATFYEIKVQECLNDWTYDKLERLEWLLDLYNMLDQ